MKLLVLNPFGTDAYNEAVRSVLEPVKRDDTELIIENLNKGPRFYRHIYVKTLTTPFIVEHILRAQSQGIDGVFIGCSYDPGVKEAQEIVDLPVVGGLIPSVMIARQIGQRFGFITDTQTGAANTYDLFKMYKLETECVGLRATDWSVADVADDPETNCKRVITVAEDLIQNGADVIVMGCTITSAYFIQSNIELPNALQSIPFLEANICSLKTLEMMVDLRKKANIDVSRKFYYRKPITEEFENMNTLRSMYGYPDL